MDIEKIRKLRLAWPFKPFDLILDDRRRWYVRLAYHLAISPKDDVLLFTGDRPGFATASPMRVIDVVMRAKRNGAKAGKRVRSSGRRARGH